MVLVVGGTVEGLQYLGVPLFGATFDPLDLVMYALGVSGGVIAELVVAPRFSGFGGLRVSRDAGQPSNYYQASPSQERRSSPSGRRPKPKRRKLKRDR